MATSTPSPTPRPSKLFPFSFFPSTSSSPGPTAPSSSSLASPSTPTPDPSSASSSSTASPSPVAVTPTASGPDAFAKNDPARTGFDPQAGKFAHILQYMRGRMTPEGEFHFREHLYAENEESSCRRCETWRDDAFMRSPMIRFLADRIGALNGRLDATNVYCRRCPARIDDAGTVHRLGGGFSADHGILICANELRDRRHFDDILAHEMVHAFDTLRWKMDHTGVKNLKHAACTEIRASMLSGECRWSQWGRVARASGDWSITQQFQKCVRDKAVRSLLVRPTVKDTEHARRLVNQVWDSCFTDTRPFDEIFF